MKLHVINLGYCTHKENIAIKGGKRKERKFYCNCILLKDTPIGNVLYDTGYSETFFSETQEFPNKLYRLFTPVYMDGILPLKEQLKELCISQIDVLIISHFHGDHICSIKDIKYKKLICSMEDLDYANNQKGFKAVSKGILRNLLPEKDDRLVDYVTLRKKHLPKEMQPFTEGYLINEYDNMILINLPGHTKHQIGIYLKEENLFFISDAIWTFDSINKNAKPNWFAYNVMYSRQQYEKTFDNLIHLKNKNNDIRLIPAHEKLKGLL